MKLLSLFSGIGAFEKALDRLKIDYELVGFSEIDKYAVKSYCAIHGVPESMNLGDITKIDEKTLPKNIDLVTYGFPCQDISLAGKQKGLFNEDGTQTRSGLFFEALRIIEATHPKVAIAENVKNLTSKKFNAQFQVVLASLDAAGYNNYWQVLNAKDYGIPQNRERVFIVSIRKDIDTGCFEFPQGFPLELRLKDLLEDEVDESYYLKETKDYFIKNSFKQESSGNGFRFCPHVKKNANIAKTITTRAGGRMDDNFVIDIESDEAFFKFDSKNPLLIKDEYGNLFVREATKKGYTEAFDGDSVNLEYPNSMTRRGRVGRGVAQTLTTSPQKAVVTLPDIRKFTEKECFRLINFDDKDFEKASKVNSGTQLYKQAGNSIVVAVPYYIIKALIKANIFIDKEKKEMELKINEVAIPEQITFNYDELKAELTEKVSMYETLVYSDEQIKEAKADKANLNKLKKALNDERIRREREYMQPFNDFKAKINEIIGIIDKPVAVIDKQVKAYEDQKKQEKMEEIKALWSEMDVPEGLVFEKVFDERMLNVSYGMNHVKQKMLDDIKRFNRDIETLSNLPEFSFEATELYKSTLDLNKALNEGHRLSEIQKKKAEYEATQAAKLAEQMAEVKKEEPKPQPAPDGFMNPPVEEEPAKQWISFSAYLTVGEAQQLRDFFEERDIEFKAV